MLYVSATPAKYELGMSQNMVEQIIRPTGLVDPEIIIKPVVGQVDHLLGEIKRKVKDNQRILVTTLTKKMAEDLTDYYAKVGIKVRYLHSDITTLERIDIIDELRRGSFDCLVGVNLLREGLDLPEVSLVGILDADKEGFLRSQTSLIQTIGRASRNIDGQVMIYADKITESIRSAVEITNNRRKIQLAYNKEHGIKPKSVVRSVKEKSKKDVKLKDNVKNIPKDELILMIQDLEDEMKRASLKLDFETAAKIKGSNKIFRRSFKLMNNMTRKGSINIKGAREHNLKNIELSLPRDKFLVITGISGSGKSSLAFDTIYAEGQRRYVESLSAYARQFLGQMKKPEVDYIEGLSPAISIDQKTTRMNPRSTVGTVTEIYDYFRLLFARVGIPHCYKCGKEISQQTAGQIVDSILTEKEDTKIQVLAPVVKDRKGEHHKVFEELEKKGICTCKGGR